MKPILQWREVSINEEEEEQEMVSVCSSCSQATEVKRKTLLADTKGDVTELEMISVQTYSRNA